MKQYSQYSIDTEKVRQLAAKRPKRELRPENMRTAQDIEAEQMLHRKAAELGINLEMTNDSQYTAAQEECDKTLALIYLTEGKDVPKDLADRLIKLKKQREQEQQKRKEYK